MRRPILRFAQDDTVASIGGLLMPPKPTTLWSPATPPHQAMLDYTAGDDRPWDARLLRWDVLGSLGHVEGLRAAKLLTNTEYVRLRPGLREALAAVDSR